MRSTQYLTQGTSGYGSNTRGTLEPLEAKTVECLVLVPTAAVQSDLLFLKQIFSVGAAFLPVVMQLLHRYLQELVLGRMELVAAPFTPQPRQEYFAVWEVAV